MNSELADFYFIDIIHFLYTNTDKKILVVCPSDEMKKMFHAKLLKGLHDLKFDSYIKRSSKHPAYRIEMLNDCRLSVVSDECGLCGATAHKVYLVEKQNFSKELMDTVMCSLYPVIHMNGGEIIGL